MHVGGGIEGLCYTEKDGREKGGIVGYETLEEGGVCPRGRDWG